MQYFTLLFLYENLCKNCMDSSDQQAVEPRTVPTNLYLKQWMAGESFHTSYIAFCIMFASLAAPSSVISQGFSRVW